jgi:hypothetical protein
MTGEEASRARIRLPGGSELEGETPGKRRSGRVRGSAVPVPAAGFLILQKRERRMQDEVATLAEPVRLTGAIHLARTRVQGTVFKKRCDLGGHFRGDFQDIENWTTEGDARDFWNGVGGEVGFSFAPFRDGTFFDLAGEKMQIRPGLPPSYRMKSGSASASPDQGMKLQALDVRGQFRWNQQVHRRPPGGCAYLLIRRGQTALAAWLSGDFGRANLCFERAFPGMRRHTKVDLRHPVVFSGNGGFFLFKPETEIGRVLYAGESASFRDVLRGFGIRYVMLSGNLAALRRTSCPDLRRALLQRAQRVSLANRWLYARLKNWRLPVGFAPAETDCRRCATAAEAPTLFVSQSSGFPNGQTRLQDQCCKGAVLPGRLPVCLEPLREWTQVVSCSCARCFWEFDNGR